MVKWYFKPQQYLRDTFTRSGLGMLIMGKKTNNQIECAQMDSNGAIKVSAVITSGAGDATAANQATQISQASTAQTSLNNIDTQTLAILNAISATAPTESTSASYTLTTSLAAIGSQATKRVTLINLSTSNTVELQINSGASIYLEAGYTMSIPCTNLNKIQAKSAAGGEVLGIIWEA